MCKRIIRGFIAALLLTGMLITLLPSCAENKQVQGAADTTAAAAAGTETVRDITSYLPQEDYQGHTFTIAARENNTHWPTLDVWAESENGEPINDAVFRRNLAIEELYNIKIKMLENSDKPALIRKIVSAGDDSVDTVLITMSECASVAAGYLVNLNKLPWLDITQKWWDTGTLADLEICGTLYGVMGDINITDNNATWAVLFNKRLAADYGLDDHYGLVSAGTWTIDKLHENCLAVTSDLNGDGAITPEDQWGAVNQYECVQALFAASGGKSVLKDKDGIPYLSMGDEKMAALLDVIVNFETDSAAQVKADDYVGKYPDVWVTVNIGTFNAGRALYYISPITSLAQLRDMEDELGILTLPKHDESQDRYYNTLQYNNATVYTVPTSVTDLDRTGMILEALAYQSVDTLTPAYYEITLKRKYTNDEESAAMLDLIFDTRIVDLGMMFDWSSITGVYGGLARANAKDFTTTYASKESSIRQAMEKTIAALTANAG